MAQQENRRRKKKMASELGSTGEFGEEIKRIVQ